MNILHAIRRHKEMVILLCGIGSIALSIIVTVHMVQRWNEKEKEILKIATELPALTKSIETDEWLEKLETLTKQTSLKKVEEQAKAYVLPVRWSEPSIKRRLAIMSEKLHVSLQRVSILKEQKTESGITLVTVQVMWNGEQEALSTLMQLLSTSGVILMADLLKKDDMHRIEENMNNNDTLQSVFTLWKQRDSKAAVRMWKEKQTLIPEELDDAFKKTKVPMVEAFTLLMKKLSEQSESIEDLFPLPLITIEQASLEQNTLSTTITWYAQERT